MFEAERKRMDAVSALETEERGGKVWDVVMLKEIKKGRKGYSDGRLLPKAKSAVPLAFCLLQCDVLRGGE